MSAKSLHRIIKTIKIIVIALLILVIAVPMLLYIPAVQDFAKNIALREVKRSTGLDISVGLVRLRFPLKVELDDVSVFTAQADTMATLGSAQVDVKFLPLLKGKIQADGLDVKDVLYKSGTPDSVMCLRAQVRHLALNEGSMMLKQNELDFDDILLDGARINLILKDTVTPEKTDTAAPSPLLIHARKITLRDVDYSMRMLPTIDSLRAIIPQASLNGGSIDLARHSVALGTFSVDSVSVAYFTPPQPMQSAKAAADTATANKASEPWTITAKTLALTARTLTYAKKGAIPLPGFDANYIQLTNTRLDIDSFYNRGSSIDIPNLAIATTERCGLPISLTGALAIDSTLLQARKIGLDIGTSSLQADATMGMGTNSLGNTPMTLLADATLHLADIETAMPTLGKTLRGLPREPITLHADVDGTMRAMHINDIIANWPRYMRVEAKGLLTDLNNPKQMGGKITLDGKLLDLNGIKQALLDKPTAKQIDIPPMTIKGTVDYHPSLIDGNIAIVTGHGKMALQGKWQSRSQGYHATLSTDRFSVSSILPAIGIEEITSQISIDGHGLNPSAHSTAIDAKIDIDHVRYLGTDYSDISLDATLAQGKAEGTLLSHNPGADVDATFSARLTPGQYIWDLDGRIHDVDLQKLGFSKTPFEGRFDIVTDGTFRPNGLIADATMAITDLECNLDGERISVPAIDLYLRADSTTTLQLNSSDLQIDAYAFTGLQAIIDKLTTLTPFIDSQIKAKSLDVRGLQQHLPRLSLNMQSGNNNAIARYLAHRGIGFNNITLNALNDSLISLQSRLTGFVSGKTRLDTINLSLNQHDRFLTYQASVNNRPGTLDDFAHVNINGYLANDKMSLLLNQHNIKGQQGFYLGLTAAMTDSVINLKFVPYSPMIAYQRWQLNTDNFVTIDYRHKHIDANLLLTNDKSHVHLYTNHPTDSLSEPESLIVNLSEIHLQDWLSISPFAPPVKGDLNADMRIRAIDGKLVGNGTIGLTDLYYGRDRVGTFDLDVDVTNTRTGTLTADVALMVDSVKVITAKGNLNDSTASSPFLLDFSMIKFPLRVANPFLPKNVAQLSGMLNGTLKITGDMAHPIFNGYLNFDSTAVKVGFTGVSYPFSKDKIMVDSSIVKFHNFAIAGLNNHNLKLNGTVDLTRLNDIGIDLGLKADNMQIVNSNRPRGADLYGKAFIDLDARAQGSLSFLNVDANLAILPETDVTYVLTSSQSMIASKSADDMVRFVQFNDTTTVAADTVQQSSMLLNLNANLNIQEGSTINVDISTDGKNKAQIKGFGSLDYSLNPMNDGRLVGRFNINSGFVRYTPPLMSEKNFKFSEGSYISFNGDILNPTLNIKAVDELKANVTQEGQNSRLVNFLVQLSVTRTLQDMDVAFDLSTNDDLTISNELASMSPEQRANQAMNMLLYNVYTGPGTKANANISGNPLFSFLESQINTWAANNIRGVDISFGIDQYDKTTDGQSETTTSYSYRVSKSLFNNRFKIVVGGNYSTDADVDENFSQNIINDISFEYMLNRSGSMYVRLFRHVGFESILEGEVTQTGVGFVYRHKIKSLKDLFHWRRSKNTTNTTSTAEK